MIQSEDSHLGCVCPECGNRCTACLGTNSVMEFYVSGDKPECVQMLPGYTHSIVNLSDTQPLVTLMWANEMFDAEHPDTFGEKV